MIFKLNKINTAMLRSKCGGLETRGIIIIIIGAMIAV